MTLSVFESGCDQKYENKCDIDNIRPYPICFHPYLYYMAYCRSSNMADISPLWYKVQTRTLQYKVQACTLDGLLPSLLTGGRGAASGVVRPFPRQQKRGKAYLQQEAAVWSSHHQCGSEERRRVSSRDGVAQVAFGGGWASGPRLYIAMYM